MPPKLVSAIKYLVLLTIAAVLLYFAFRGISLQKVIHEMKEANIFWLFLSVFFSIIALFSRAYRWKLLIEPLGYAPAFRKTFYALMIGYFANLAFPRLGEVSRCGALSKSASIPFSSLLGTVIVERFIDLFSLLICILIVAVVELNRLGNFLSDTIIHPLFGKFNQVATSPLFIISAIAFLVIIFFLTRYLRNKAKQSKYASRILIFIKELLNGLKSVGQLKKPWLFIFHSIFIWVLYYFSVYVCFDALPATKNLGFGAALFVLVAGGLGMSAPVQGGIGAYHLLVSQGLILYGLSKLDGLVFATLIHSFQVLTVVLFGLISLILLFAERKKNDLSLLNSDPVKQVK